MTNYIQFNQVHKTFDGIAVLEGVSFGVERGETFAILGHSGAGKTVLLSHVVGFLTPDTGKVLVDGRDVTSMNERDLNDIRKKVQLVFQSGALFDSLSVRENVAFPLEDTGLAPREIEMRVTETLELVEIEDIADLMPAELSTGAKRAVSIARALAAKPEAILYDEPTTMVDPLLSQSINDLINKMSKLLGLTQIVVTHDINNCAERVADRVALLHAGKFVFVGTMEELYVAQDPVVREFVEEDRYRLKIGK